MEYTVQRLAKLAGVSPRALRYYDQIGLLRPVRNASSGYRIYGEAEVDRLQQILFYRELGVALEEIGAILDDPRFDRLEALRGHRQRLLAQSVRLDTLLRNVAETIEAAERGTTMHDKMKFDGFKQELVVKNEKQYGKEIREKYGDGAVDAANAKLMGLSKEAYEEMEATGAEILRLLDEAFAAGDSAGEAARRAAELHRKWLGYTWPDYSAEAHRGLADMYVADERFAAYYDRGTPGKAQLLRDAIYAYLGCV